MNRNPVSIRSGESGAALIVVLVLLIVVTLLGLISMRGALLQERMAANTVARGIAFQAAESGLRQAELMARDGMVTFPDGQASCSAGRCSHAGTGTPAWEANDFWEDGGAGYELGTTVGTGNAAITPKFVIEDLGTATIMGGSGSGASDPIDGSIPPPSSAKGEQRVYRITSYAATRTGAEVMLQTIYRR